MILEKGGCVVTIREEHGFVFLHLDLDGEMSVPQYRWMSRLVNFYVDDIGQVAVCPPENDDKLKRLVTMLGFVPTMFKADYLTHQRRIYICHKH